MSVQFIYKRKTENQKREKKKNTNYTSNHLLVQSKKVPNLQKVK